MTGIFPRGKSRRHHEITWMHHTILSGPGGSEQSQQRWGDKMVNSRSVLCVSTAASSHRLRSARVCWTWIHWALCPQSGEWARCPGRWRRWRIPEASRTTADRRGPWCRPQSVCRQSSRDAQRQNETICQRKYTEWHLITNRIRWEISFAGFWIFYSPMLKVSRLLSNHEILKEYKN